MLEFWIMGSTHAVLSLLLYAYPSFVFILFTYLLYFLFSLYFFVPFLSSDNMDTWFFNFSCRVLLLAPRVRENNVQRRFPMNRMLMVILCVHKPTEESWNKGSATREQQERDFGLPYRRQVIPAGEV